jgi:heptosyltransferase-1
VLLLHGTTWQSKHYPETLWMEIVARARADGFEVLLVHGSAEEERRARQFAGAGATVLERMPLGSLIERLSTIAVVIGVDSGLSHVAAALDRPVVGLYGPTDAGLTGIRGRRVHNLVTTLPCAPCRRQVCTLPDRASFAVDPPCFGPLQPAEVWRRARAVAEGA